MKEFIILVPVLLTLSFLGSLVVAFVTMILFGNLSFIFEAVPAISFWSALSISFPVALLATAFSNTGKD